MRRALSAGAAGYLPKRSSDRDLVAAIRLVADGGGYVDPDLGAQLVTPNGSAALEPLVRTRARHLHLLALGHTNQEIGKKLFISVRTVDTHRAHIMRKLELETRAELVMFALANGSSDPESARRTLCDVGPLRSARPGRDEEPVLYRFRLACSTLQIRPPASSVM